ncbi:MAG: signal peptide peptidase SppA [Oscillospiraceae bacterium]|nr:signal peptide peptidase SppA [Oscillospiraceae bacterium]
MKFRHLTGPITALLIVILLLAFFLFVGSGVASAFQTHIDPEATPGGDYFSVLTISGSIENVTPDAFHRVGYNHNATLSHIYYAAQDAHNKGLFLYLDTPGGTVYESDELYLALKEYKEYTGRPVYAYMCSMAASGGYYVSCAADRITANRNCLTGSIGVIMGMTNLKGLYDKLGIEEVQITSGVNKGMGSSGLQMTEEQRAIYQSIVDESYQQFVGCVEEGRPGLTRAQILKLADGRIYTAQQAVDNGLIDGIMPQEEALAEMQHITGAEPFITDFSGGSAVSDLFYGARELTPKTEAETVAELLASTPSGVPLYLANGFSGG